MTDYFTAAATAGLDYATDAAERQEAADHDAMADRIIAELPALRPGTTPVDTRSFHAQIF